MVAAEQEFLFPPYICFEIEDVKEEDGIFQIHLKVMSNNKEHRENVAVAPWG